jgi:hypothetical protein
LASFAFGKRGSDERLIDLAFDSFKRHCWLRMSFSRLSP